MRTLSVLTLGLVTVAAQAPVGLHALLEDLVGCESECRKGAERWFLDVAYQHGFTTLEDVAGAGGLTKSFIDALGIAEEGQQELWRRFDDVHAYVRMDSMTSPTYKSEL